MYASYDAVLLFLHDAGAVTILILALISTLVLDALHHPTAATI